MFLSRFARLRSAAVVTCTFVLLVIGAAVVRSGVAPRQHPRRVEWPVTVPERLGLDEAALERFRKELAAHQTAALILARRGRIVMEWYAPGTSWHTKRYTAAMLKGTAAMPTLIAAAQRDLISFDDHIAKWVPSWREDPERSRITVQDLAFHVSGMENIEFERGEKGLLLGWKRRYYDDPAGRFRLAVDSAGLLYEPRSRLSYSGVGYYVLSYVVTQALRGQPYDDIRSFLGETVYDRIGIPRKDWSIGYGRLDVDGDLKLVHFGSGGAVTARAAARIGQLFLQRGCWQGVQILDADLVDTVLGRNAGSVPFPREMADTLRASGGGWWLNVNGDWPSAPRSGAVAVGNGHQITWIDPELELVVVRLGEDLAMGEEASWAAFDRYFVRPLYEAVGGAGELDGPEDAPTYDEGDSCRG